MTRESFGASSGASETERSRSVLTRADALVRALNGVADVRVEADETGRIRLVYVVAASGVGGKALIRNVQSALRAALNLAIEPGSIVLMPALPAAKPAASHEVVESTPGAPAPKPVLPKPVKRRMAAAGVVNAARRAVIRPTPQIELLELHRFNQDQLQCKVVIELAGQRRTGSAVAGDERAGGVTLAARATLNALESLEPAEWAFEGAADVIIGGQRHICVSVRKSREGGSLTGAAPVADSVERAVATAVLNAAGLSNASTRQQRRLVTT